MKRTQSISDRERKGEKSTHHLAAHGATHLGNHHTPAVETTFNGIVAIVTTLSRQRGSGQGFVEANDGAAPATP
jgi:hypothetical protein